MATLAYFCYSCPPSPALCELQFPNRIVAELQFPNSIVAIA